MNGKELGELNKEFNKENLVKTIKRYQGYGHPEFYELLERMADLHSRKNHDYAGDTDPLRNFKASVSIGIEPWRGCLLRMQDKMMRIQNFANCGEMKVVDEKVTDTLLDLSVYSLLCLILYLEKDKNE